MGWLYDVIAEIDAACNKVRAMSDEEIAERLRVWNADCVTIEWGDFVKREYLRQAELRLRARAKEVRDAR